MTTDSAALSRLIPFSIRDAFSEPEQLLSAYFHESTVGLCILDAEFRYLAINPALAQMHGLSADAHLSKTCREMIGDLADKIEPEFKRILATGQPVVGLEISGLLPSRKEVGHWSANYFPTKDASGHVKQIGVVVVEITKRKELEQSLRYLAATLQEEKDRLQLLHEIDTTLGSSLELQDLLIAITGCIKKVIPCDIAGTWLYDRKAKMMRAAALESPVGEVFCEGEETPIAECMLGQAMLAGVPAVLNHEQVAAMPFPGAKKLMGQGIKSICGIPLITPKGPLGALGLGRRDPQGFSREEIDLLSHGAISIALALENALTHQALQREKARLQALREVDAALVARLDLNELLITVSRCLLKAVPHASLGIHLYDESNRVLRDHGPSNQTKTKIIPDGVVKLDESVAGQVFLERKTRVVEHAELVTVPYAVAQRAIAEGVRSLCFVPLITGDGPAGVLVLSSRTDHTFGQEQIDILEPVAAAIAQAVAHAQAQSALEQKRARLQALHDIDETLAASLDLHQMLPEVSWCLHKTLPHDHIAICIYDERKNGLRDHSATSDLKKRISAPSGLLPLEASLTGRTFMEGRSRVYEYAELVNIPFTTTQRALQAGIRSSCFIPLAAAKGRIGVLTVSSHRDAAFRQEDLGFLEQVAAALGQALQNALAHKAVQEEKKRLQVLLNVTTALAANWNIPRVFPTISAYLRRVLRQEYATFLLKDEKSGLLVTQAVDFPLCKGLCDEIKITSGDSPIGKSVDRGAPMTFEKEELEAFHVEITEGLLAEGIRCLCCVPLVRSKVAFGALVLGSTRDDAFKADDLLLVNQVASQLAVAIENHRVSLEIEALKDRLASERRYLEGEIRTEPYFEEIVGESTALRQTLRQVETVANSDATVLILGETGTGKELVARAIHRASKRRERKFIKLNCAAIPTGLLESELFGHEKGAFTGAVSRKIGHLELADGGTLFLDEVGEIPMELQPKLLRVLQDHEFERLGGTKTIKVDLRLIAATNRDLAKRVAENEFRSDLFYRLNVFPIRMPSLRERRGDIPLLVRHFVHRLSHNLNRHIETIPTETMNALIHWDWPGNVRELENFIARSLILSEGEALLAPLGELQMSGHSSGSPPSTLQNAEREHILRVLRETRGVISGPNGAAHRLGLKRSTLQSKMDRLGIVRKHFSDESQT